MTLEQRVAMVEKNLAIYQAGEQAREKQLAKIENAMFGKNGENGLVDDLKDLKNSFEKITEFKDRFVKISLWIIGLIVTPILGAFGFFLIKVLAHMDEIMKALDYIERISK